MADFNLVSELLQKGKAKDLSALVAGMLDEGVSANDILTNGLVAGMNVVGVKQRNICSRSADSGACHECGS